MVTLNQVRSLFIRSCVDAGNGDVNSLGHQPLKTKPELQGIRETDIKGNDRDKRGETRNADSPESDGPR